MYMRLMNWTKPVAAQRHLRLASMAVFVVSAGVFLTACPGGGGGALLQVYPSAINFGLEKITDDFVITNSGSGQLGWRLTGVPDWVTPSQMSGVAGPGTTVVSLTVDRNQAEPGQSRAQIMVRSNGGDRAVSVSVLTPVPPDFEAGPATLDFGAATNELSVTITNTGGTELPWTLSVDPASEWTPDLEENSGTLAMGASVEIGVTADRTDLAPGDYEATLVVEAAGRQEEILANISKPDPGEFEGELQVSGTEIGIVPPAVQGGIQLANVGLGDLAWQVGVPTEAWLTVSPLGVQDSLEPGSAPVDVTAQVDPLHPDLQDPGIHTAQFNIVQTIDDGDDVTVTVTVTYQVRETEISITPNSVEFGQFATIKYVNLTKLGNAALTATLDAFEADEALNPNEDPGPWLLVDKKEADGSWTQLLPGAGLPSGPMSLDDPVMLRLTLNRAAAIAATSSTEPFEAALHFSDSEGNEATLDISFLVAPDVQIAISDAPGNELEIVVPFSFEPRNPEADPLETFTINHVGNSGELIWSIDTVDLPEWIREIKPSSGTLLHQDNPNTEEDETRAVVGVYPDVYGMVDGDEPEDYTLTIDSNAANAPNGTDIVISLDISTRGEIVTDTPGLLLPSFQSVSVLGVANSAWSHSPFSNLEFDIGIVRTPGAEDVPPHPRDWLFVEPSQGESVALMPPGLDWELCSVAVDRYLLEGTNGTAMLVVDNRDRNRSNQTILKDEEDDMIDRVNVLVEVEIQDMTVEGPAALMRTPSQLRAPLSLRNRRVEALYNLPEELSGAPGAVNSLQVFEDEQPMEQVETYQFVGPPTTMRADVLLLLDFSMSMVQAAGSVEDLARSYVNAIEDLLAYDGAAGPDTIPPNFRFAVMEFHDRAQTPQVVHWFTDYREKSVESVLFPGREITVFSGGLEQAYLAGTFSQPGSTDLLPAVTEAANLLSEADSIYSALDQAELRAIVCISDGRLTTPPGQVTSLARELFEARVSFYGIGWGGRINGVALATLAAETLGHFYAAVGPQAGAKQAPADPTLLVNPAYSYRESLAIDEDGAEYIAENFDLTPPGKIQLLRQDLAAYVTLNYITLTEDSGLPIKMTARVDGDELPLPPGVVDPPVPPEVPDVVVGSIEERTYDTALAAGDVRIGQVAMRSRGILPTTESPLADVEPIEVIVRADYIPRGCREIHLTVSAPMNFTVGKVAETEGGIVEDWDIAGVGGLANSYDIELSAPVTVPGEQPEPLPYGIYGDLLKLVFPNDGSVGDFQVSLQVDSSPYLYEYSLPLPAGATPPDRIAFNYATSLEVRNFGWSHAPAVPFVQAQPKSFDFDRFRNNFLVTVVGGDPEPVDWEVVSAPDYLSYLSSEGVPLAGLPRKEDPDLTGNSFWVVIDRDAVGPGETFGVIIVQYETLGLDFQGTSIIDFSVLNP